MFSRVTSAILNVAAVSQCIAVSSRGKLVKITGTTPVGGLLVLLSLSLICLVRSLKRWSFPRLLMSPVVHSTT